MSSRRPMYHAAVGLLAILFSALQVLIGAVFAVEAYRTRQWPLACVPGITQKTTMNPLGKLLLWRDKLVHFGEQKQVAPMIWDVKMTLVDPETGRCEILEPVVRLRGHTQIRVFGDRLWLVGQTGADELVQGSLQSFEKSKFPESFNDYQDFSWDGTPAFIESTKKGLKVSTFQNGVWKSIGVVAGSKALETEWTFDDSPGTFGVGSTPQVIQASDGLHLFIHSRGRVLYRHGLEIESNPVTMVEQARVNESTDQTAESNDDTMAERDSAVAGQGWLLVRDQPTDDPMYGASTHAILIGGRPAVLLIDDSSKGKPVGRVYRLEGMKWNEFVSFPFPFGSSSFRTVTTRDGNLAYVGVRASLGASYFYAIDSNGFRETTGSAVEKTYGLNWGMANLFLMSLIEHGLIFLVPFGLGIFLAVGIWLLMRWFTRSTYIFGIQTVALASVLRRGTARTFDLICVLMCTFVVVWSLTRTVNWLELAEALNLRVDHPAVSIAARAAWWGGGSLFLSGFALLLMQSAWGVTPGKWLCGLRTVRTSLRRCGFAASLAREIVFFVDCCNFCCWTPGIVSIALTDRRQRLGDLVADTIVVEARSLKSTSIDASPSSGAPAS